jgi:hypothetical protein
MQIRIMRLVDALAEEYDPRLSRIFHAPNGGNRSAREGARFKAAGVRAGVPDLMYPAPIGGYAGLAIELKTKTGRPTESQSSWLDWLNEQGYRTQIARTEGEALGLIVQTFEVPIDPLVLENRILMIGGTW